MTRPSAAMPSAEAQAGPEAANKPRILIVDDEPSMREMLRIVLRRDGYEVMVAANGTEAIDILQRERMDLLLSDIRMPDISGVDVLRAAKEANRDLVVFMMTAYASTDTAVEAMRLGAVDYLTKPFNMDELRLKVRQQLDTLRMKQENVLLKRALNTSHEFSQHHRPQRRDARSVQDDRDDRQDQQHGPDHGRVGNRQGPGRARRALQLAAARSPVRRAQLRRPSRDAARVGAVRPHAWCVHRAPTPTRRGWSKSPSAAPSSSTRSGR